MACCGSQTADTHCSIQLLNGTEVNMNIQRKMIGGDVLDRVFNHLNMVELDYFGLRFVDNDNQTHWLHPEKSVLKQLKHVSTKTLYFGVKFYVEDPCKLSEEVTRYQFFLQLKMDMLQGRLPCSFGQAADLCAYAVQSELGDYSAEMHPDGYVSEFRFIPNQTEDLEKAIAANHKRLRGLLPAKAELGFLDRAKRLEMYGVDLYPVQGEDHVEYFLGTTPQGVVVYRNKSKVATYYWSKIRQMNFRQTEFKIIVEDKEYTWQLPSRASCKHLFQCYIEQHMFFRLRPSMLERNGTLTKSLKSNGSRYSFRTQEEALQYSLRLRRPEPQVHRVPSRRYLRRVSANDADDSVYINHSSLMMSGGSPALEEDGISIVPGRVTKTVAPEPVQRSQSQLGGRDSPTSGTSVRSVPWEDTDGGMSDRGMYTQRGESPVSMRSGHRSRRPHSRSSSPGQTRRRHRHSDRSGSETESVSSRKYRYRRSLTGSEASEDEMTHRRRRRRRRSRSRDSSGSEGENRHRTRRSRSRDHMVDSEAQWTAVQAGEGGQRGEVREPGDAVVKNLKNGYEPTEASDGYKWYKERSQLADIKASTELRKHIQLGLQDPSAEDDLQNIAYTKVVTEDGVAIRVSHSANRPRSRPSSGAYRRSRGEFTEENESVHSGKGSVHSKRSTVSRRTDPGPQRNGSYRHSMPLDLIETGPDARSSRPQRPISYYESDNQRDGRRHRRHREESNRDRSGSGSTVGGGGGHEELPSYLSAQRGQGMFGQQQRADGDRYSSAINQSEMQSQQPAPPYEAVMSSQQSRREDKVASLPPSYAPPPRYVSSHHPVAGGNTNASAHLSSRLESIHSREDSGFEQEEVSYGTRSHPRHETVPIHPHDRPHPRIHGDYPPSERHHQGPQTGYVSHGQFHVHSPSEQLPSMPDHYHQDLSNHKSSSSHHLPSPSPIPLAHQQTATQANPPHSAHASTVISSHQRLKMPSAAMQTAPTLPSGSQSSSVGAESAYGGSDVMHSDATPLPNGLPHHRNSYDASIGLVSNRAGRLHSQVGIQAVSELLNELDKLGRGGVRGSNQSSMSSRSSAVGEKMPRKSWGVWEGHGSVMHPASQQHPKHGGNSHPSAPPDCVPNQDNYRLPVVVSSKKRMSLTTQEILRVSRSDGRNHNVVTEL